MMPIFDNSLKKSRIYLKKLKARKTHSERIKTKKSTADLDWSMDTKETGLREKHLLGLDAQLPYLSF